eukprot:4525554-Pyramimonas_sp.AAC.1
MELGDSVLEEAGALEKAIAALMVGEAQLPSKGDLWLEPGAVNRWTARSWSALRRRLRRELARGLEARRRASRPRGAPAPRATST